MSSSHKGWRWPAVCGRAQLRPVVAAGFAAGLVLGCTRVVSPQNQTRSERTAARAATLPIARESVRLTQTAEPDASVPKRAQSANVDGHSDEGPDEPIALSDYAVYASVALTGGLNGVRGVLQLLQDKRLTPAVRNYISGGGYCLGGWAEHPEFCESVDSEPLRPAIVRMSDTNGRAIAVRRMQRELAFLKTAYLYETRKPTYLVAVDLRRGAGGWAPVCTHLAEVEHGKLQWLSAILASDNTRFEITLCESLHAEWRIVPSREGRGREIVFVSASADGIVSLGRYVWQGKSWRLAISTSAGSWDTERTFPDLRQFP